MREILMLNLSPKGNSATSLVILNHLAQEYKIKDRSDDFNLSIETLKDFTDKGEILELINKANDIIFATPLYVDSLPSYVIEFLDYLDENLSDANEKNLYGVVNCGFLESYYTLPALSELENFATEKNFNWRVGLGIGAGGMISGSGFDFNSKMNEDIHFAINSFIASLFNQAPLNDKNITVTAKMPKRFYIFMANRSFKKMAKQNKAKIKAKPHLKKYKLKN